MADLVGTRLGQYQILERISRGGSSTVYKAYHAKLDRFVAIKVLSPHFIDEEGFLERFQREAQAVARLDHPNILPVYDYDQTGEVVYIVMRYINTGTLRDLMTSPLDLRDTMEIITQIGMALGYAHKQAVIHRDVKPTNILIAEGQWALLTDFGLAKIQGGEHKVTQSGVGVGTPDYMSPEQAQGLPVDGRSDLYSLGAMLYEMLTGQTPFEGDSGMSILIKHITDPVKPPHEITPGIPIEVEQVIMKALSKDPNQRFQTAESMVAAFARAVGPIGGRVVSVAAGIDKEEARAQAEADRSIPIAPNAARRSGAAVIRSARSVARLGGSIRSHWRAIGIGLIVVALGGLVLSGRLQFTSISIASTPTIEMLTPVSTLDGTGVADMVLVPGGSFTMGATTGDAKADEGPTHVVTLDSFYIDRTEVTNAQFAAFAAASDYKTDAERTGSATTWRIFNTLDRQQFPVTQVTWNDATRYCGYNGQRLPTEAEWEYAARGDTQRVYPWGDVFSDQSANTLELGLGQPVTVATHSSPSPFGVYDMSGNVQEWVRDWYAADYYARSSSSDPTGPASGVQKVIRGGSFKTRGQFATTTAREQASIDSRGDDIGFRCAMTP
jgi:serine/threonine-protein kinase